MVTKDCDLLSLVSDRADDFRLKTGISATYCFVSHDLFRLMRQEPYGHTGTLPTQSPYGTGAKGYEFVSVVTFGGEVKVKQIDSKYQRLMILGTIDTFSNYILEHEIPFEFFTNESKRKFDQDFEDLVLNA